MKTYFNENEKDEERKKAYEKLKEIIDDEQGKYWKPSNATTELNGESNPGIKPNFFRITRQQDNEVMFSNMFFYLFSKYPELMVDLIKRISKNKIIISKKAIVEREKEHMDLRIIDDYYIIIENKIKSGINGMKTDNETKDFKRGEDGKYLSQLSDYYGKAKKHFESENGDDQKTDDELPIKGYIFTPNYNDIDIDKFSCGDKYKKIKYSEIYEFFKNYQESTNDNVIKEDVYFKDFIKAIEKHTKDVDDEFREELMQRFIERTT